MLPPTTTLPAISVADLATFVEKLLSYLEGEAFEGVKAAHHGVSLSLVLVLILVIPLILLNLPAGRGGLRRGIATGQGIHVESGLLGVIEHLFDDPANLLSIGAGRWIRMIVSRADQKALTPPPSTDEKQNGLIGIVLFAAHFRFAAYHFGRLASIVVFQTASKITLGELTAYLVRRNLLKAELENLQWRVNHAVTSTIFSILVHHSFYCNHSLRFESD